ncbi:hypothetical protein A2U01_0014170 [Trifolium medium]|uniref:Uncharacterized protein n=1 Tax=Trifolium medium TaxID=97028 RepID=A0A392N0V4_9FABA|nr:hypothetical protein [Trifolium medium]
MPKVNVRTFNITKFQVDYSSQKMDTIISLGKTTLGGFAQMPRNETDLDMTMTTNDANVNKYAADDLKSDISAYEMVFDVYISGKIGVQIGSLHMINVPFLSSCEQIKKMDVDYGRKPECDIKMFSFR